MEQQLRADPYNHVGLVNPAIMAMSETDCFFYEIFKKDIPFETLPRNIKVKYMRWRSKHYTDLRKLNNDVDYDINRESMCICKEQLFQNLETK